MKIFAQVFFILSALLVAPFAKAFDLGDVLRQGGNVVVDTERNKSSVVIDAARRKSAIDTEAKRQVASLDTLIDANDRRIENEIEPKLIDARVDMRALDRDRENGVIDRGDYWREKQMISARMTDLLNSKKALKEQNAEYARRQQEILANAESQKRQVDADTSANVDQATTQQNSNILNRIIWGIGR